MLSRFISFTLILALSFQCQVKLGLLTYYSVNIEYIINELCENKDKPELNCKGKCFLKKKMAQADESEKKTSEIFKQVEFPAFIPNSSLSLGLKSIELESTHAPVKDLYDYQSYIRIFHPPLS